MKTLFGAEVEEDMKDLDLNDYMEGFKEDRFIGYIPEACISCGRIRVGKYESGKKVCEKCGLNQVTKEYDESRKYI